MTPLINVKDWKRHIFHFTVQKRKSERKIMP